MSQVSPCSESVSPSARWLSGIQSTSCPQPAGQLVVIPRRVHLNLKWSRSRPIMPVDVRFSWWSQYCRSSSQAGHHSVAVSGVSKSSMAFVFNPARPRAVLLDVDVAAPKSSSLSADWGSSSLCSHWHGRVPTCLKGCWRARPRAPPARQPAPAVCRPPAWNTQGRWRWHCLPAPLPLSLTNTSL
jgi:hypothetical protein